MSERKEDFVTNLAQAKATTDKIFTIKSFFQYNGYMRALTCFYYKVLTTTPIIEEIDDRETNYDEAKSSETKYSN